MKSGTIILVTCCLFSSSVSASKWTQNPDQFNLFNFWLEDNGYDYRVGCEGDLDKVSPYFLHCCVDKDGNRVPKDPNNHLKPKRYKDRWSIPYKENPDRDTLIYYNYKNLHSHETGSRGETFQWDRYEVSGSMNPYQFTSELRKEKLVDQQLHSKAILSYLFYENGKIVVDEISPKDRFGDFIDNDTKLRSNSMGKSMASYVLGHAICEGYINDEEVRLDDWELVKGTLYEGQRLIDLLNMRSGDQKYVFGAYFRPRKSGQNFNSGRNSTDAMYEIETRDLRKLMHRMQGLEKSKSTYNYTVVNTLLIQNYIIHKAGDNFDSLLKKVFVDKAQVADSVYFFKIPRSRPENGDINQMFFATRYDYLRIAKAMMDDWQNDTCVGQYLKRVYEKRQSKGSKGGDEPAFNNTKSYGGQFHFDYPSLEDRVILGLGGYGGQAILIDVEKSRIAMVHSIHFNNSQYKYDVKGLLINPIKNGKFSSW